MDVSRRSPLRILAAACIVVLLGASAAEAASLEVRILNLRNDRGMVHLCLSSGAEQFPDCRGAAASLSLSRPASQAGTIRFSNIQPGTYALSVVHDENGNGSLDKFLAIPREGFGFSNNPRLKMRAPRFEEASFVASGASSVVSVKMIYLP